MTSRTWLSVAFTLSILLLSTASSTAIAQTPVNIDQLATQAMSQMLGDERLSQVIEKIKKNPVHIIPDVIVIDRKTNTATLQLTNPGDDSVKASLLAQYAPPTTAGHKPVANGLVADDSTPNDTLGRGVVDKRWSLESWVRDLPAELILKAHETRTLTLHCVVPDSLKSGEYSAYIVVRTDPLLTVTGSQEPSASGSSVPIQGSMPVVITTNDPQLIHAAKLTYRVDNK